MARGHVLMTTEDGAEVGDSQGVPLRAFGRSMSGWVEQLNTERPPIDGICA